MTSLRHPADAPPSKFDPLTNAAFIARLIGEVTHRPPAEVLPRLRREFESPGSTVAEEVRHRRITPYVHTEAMDALYSESDAFLYESAVWNRNALKCRMRRRVRTRLEWLRKALGRAALDVLVIGDGPGFDSLDLARAGHNVTYHELPGFQEAFARRLFDECGGDVHIITDRHQIPKHSFDAVICLDVLEHVDDPPAVVRSLVDYLRPEGMFIAHAPFYMIHPAYPTHLRRNRRFSGRLNLYRDAGLRLVHGTIGWNPLVFVRDGATVSLPRLRGARRLAIFAAGAYFRIGRRTALPFAVIHWARRINARWFDDLRR